MGQDIKFSEKGHIGLITLNRAQALNALNLPMILALQQQLSLWQEDSKIHAVVIQAVSGKAFCAGGDIRFLYQHKGKSSEQMQFFLHEYRLNHFIHCYKKPYIALMNGMTMGGGVGISLHGSHRVASEHFEFAMPETGIGFFPDIGASYLLARCSNHMGLYLGLTGQRINYADAKWLELVDYLIPADKYEDVLQSLIECDLSIDPNARVNKCLQTFVMPDPVVPVKQVASFINHCFASDSIEVVFEKLAASQDNWHKETLEMLEKKSSVSLKVTLEQLHKAKEMTFDDCLQMDYRLASHFMKSADFYEGIRALLIDKDKSPQWKSSDVFTVAQEEVNRYFEPDCEPIHFL